MPFDFNAELQKQNAASSGAGSPSGSFNFKSELDKQNANPTSAAVSQVQKQLNPDTTQAHPLDGFLKSGIGKMFTGSTQAFADTLGSAASVATGDTQKQNEAHMAEAESRFNLAKQLRTASPEEAAKIRSQLSQAPNIGTATEVNPTLNKTGEQVVGEGLGTGLEALSGGTLGGEGGAAKTLVGAIGKGAVTGGIYGLLSGTSQGMQENQSVGGVGKSALVGGAAGAAVGGALGAAGYGISKIPEKLDQNSEDIYRKVLKMTPTESKNESLQGKNTPTLLKDLGLVGTPAEMGDKLGQIYDAKEAALQNTLVDAAKGGATVSTDQFEKDALASIDQYKTHVAEFGNIKSKLETIIANTRTNFGDQIPVDVANKIKSGLWKDSFNPAGTQVVNDAIYEAGSSMKNLIEKAVPSADIAAQNKELGQYIVASKQLTRSAFRPQGSKLTKFIGSAIGASIGGHLGLEGGIGGAALGSQIDKITSNPTLRTGIAKIMAKAADAVPETVPAVMSEAKDFIIRHLLMEAGKTAVQANQPSEKQ